MANASSGKKKFNPLLIMILIFIALVVVVFITQNKASINWLEDYKTAVELAEKQNKPLLLAFYKPNAPMCTRTFNDTYKSPKVKEFVESNFVPVLINVDKHPKLADTYKVSYYPTHFVKDVKSNKLSDPRLGYDPPGSFIEVVTELLEKTK